VGAVCIQTVFLHYLPLNVPLDLFLVLICCGGFHFRAVPLLCWGLFVGLVGDSISGGLFGAGAFTRTILAYLLIWLKGRFILKGMPVLMLIVFMGTILDGGILFMVRGLFDAPQGAIDPVMLILRAGCNAVVAPVVMNLLGPVRQDEPETF
jgi:rod shape-determining protein MreD